MQKRQLADTDYWVDYRCICILDTMSSNWKINTNKHSISCDAQLAMAIVGLAIVVARWSQSTQLIYARPS